MRAKGWRCHRQAKGERCGAFNLAKYQLCGKCGKRKPPRRKPAHMAILASTSYEECVALFGEKCGICGAGPKTRRLQRDHEHKGAGSIRGLLCVRCNRSLPAWMTSWWLRRAAEYLDAHALREPYRAREAENPRAA